jgi:hypothetical protein
MEENINDKTFKKFAMYMFIFTLGLITLHIIIRPIFTTITVPFLMERNISYEKDNELIPIKKLDFDGLPAILYQYYDNKTKINLNFVNTINKNVLNSSEFDIYLFNNKDARHFIQINFDNELLPCNTNLT